MLVPAIPPPFPLRWGFTTRHDTEGLPPVRLRQVHGCGIHRADGAAWERLDGDGLWTTSPGIPIGVRVADCVPVLLAGMAGDRPWVAALHAGWRGVVAGILRKGVAAFREAGGHPDQLVFAFGPSIQLCHFEIGPEVLDAARQDSAWAESLARPGRGDRTFLDLHGLLRRQALELGLDPAREGSISRCTLCEQDTFHSFRGGDTDGRQWGVVEILPV